MVIPTLHSSTRSILNKAFSNFSSNWEPVPTDIKLLTVYESLGACYARIAKAELDSDQVLPDPMTVVLTVDGKGIFLQLAAGLQQLAALTEEADIIIVGVFDIGERAKVSWEQLSERDRFGVEEDHHGFIIRDQGRNTERRKWMMAVIPKNEKCGSVRCRRGGNNKVARSETIFILGISSKRPYQANSARSSNGSKVPCYTISSPALEFWRQVTS